MKHVTVLPVEFEKCILEIIDEKKKMYDLGAAFPNPLLRDDVLNLLDLFCTVVYYPLDNEKNNGFHMTNIPLANGEQKDFVFINTAQTIEKQVFTAAHELGHIWNIDDAVLQKVELNDTPENRELIINRFAAVLLIPEEIFKKCLSLNFRKLSNTSGEITILNMLRLIVLLMNQFFVPRKSIVLRMVELGVLDPKPADILLGYGEIPDSKIDDVVEALIAEYGFTKFQNPSRKKWIEGLSELLEKAETDQLLPQEKIEHMRNTFDISAPKPITEGLNHVVSLSTQEGLDS